MKKLFMLVLATALVSCLLLAACGAPEEETTTTVDTSTPAPEGLIELDFAYSQPPQSGFAKAILIPWATDLEAATNGRIKITQHGGASLLRGEQAYDGLLSGMCDITEVDPAKQGGRLPRGEIMMLPLVFPNGEVEAIAYHEWLLEHADAEIKDVKLLITCPMPEQNYMGNEPIETLEDFQGLKLRAAGKVDTDIVEALGATAVAVTTEDAFSALDTGLIDGQFFSWEGALIFGFGDICKYKTECYIYESCFQLQMNKQVYNDLPDDIKQIVDDFSTLETSRKYAADFMAMLPGARGALESKGTEAGFPPIYVLPAEERARWVAALQPIVDKWIEDMEDEGMPGQEMYDDLVSIVAKYS